MAEKVVQNSSFNLISKEVNFSRKLKSEQKWYSNFNLVILVAITVIGIVSYLFTVYNNVSLESKKTEVANFANQNVFTPQRLEIENKLSIINDKYSLYNEVRNQSIDAVSFYNSLVEVYPGLVIDTLNFRSGTEVKATVIIESNSHSELPVFLSRLHERYENVRVMTINFRGGESSVENVDAATISALIELEFK
jgi:hypothetical protein